MIGVKVKKIRAAARMPHYGSAGAAGADLHACLDAPTTIPAGASAFIPTGLAVELPEGHAGLVYARSGLACKSGLAPANKVGVIDCDYRGEVVVCLHNHSGEERTVAHGDRIAQLVIVPCPQAQFLEADELTSTDRGAGGFGSTGR